MLFFNNGFMRCFFIRLPFNAARTLNRLNTAYAQHTLHTSKQIPKRNLCCFQCLLPLAVLGFCARSTDTIHWETSKSEPTPTNGKKKHWNILYADVEDSLVFSE